ncbi:MAG: T9SS type A sorting domain-containing protein [Flavobacteriales bacterium]|nr:T9SS type A sorting domain-containing protein [Flavobacteriales bacterium]
MRVLGVLILFFGGIYTGFNQDTNWIKGHQMNFDKVGMNPILEQGKILASCNVRFQGGSYFHVLAEYNRNGDFVQKTTFLKQYYDLTVGQWLSFSNGNILFLGDGQNPNSGTDYQNFSVLFDKTGNVIQRLHHDSSFTHIAKNNDSSFYGIDYLDSSCVGLYNSVGKALWRKSMKTLLQLQPTDTILNYKFHNIKSYNDYFLLVYLDKRIDKYRFLKFNQSASKLTEDTIELNGLHDFQPAWGGYVVNTRYTDTVEYVKYINKESQIVWEKQHFAKKMVWYNSMFINNSNRIVVPVVFTYPDSSKVYSNQHYFTRVFIYDSLGNETDIYEYRMKNYAVNMSVIDQFSDGGYFLGYGSYAQLADLHGSLMCRTNKKGEIPDSSFYGYAAFPDVSVKDSSISVARLKKVSSIHVYPNPSKTHLTVSTSGRGTMKVKMQNIGGEVLLECSFKTQIDIDISNFPNGLYFLEILGEGILETKKMIISH